MALTDTTPPLRPLEAVIALPDGSTMRVVGLSVGRAGRDVDIVAEFLAGLEAPVNAPMK